MDNSEIRWLDCLDRALRMYEIQKWHMDADMLIALAQQFYDAMAHRDDRPITV